MGPLEIHKLPPFTVVMLRFEYVFNDGLFSDGPTILIGHCCL